jgi:WS/DGAT/MGAT family acyltransferase
MEHMHSLDAMFLDAEDGDPHASMAIASIAVLEGPAPTADEFARSIAGRLPLIPRYRQRAVRVPFNLSQPVWVDDPDFDLSYHLRTTALPAPGDDEALSRLVGRLMSQRLDRERPLWEYWLITGLADGRWALLSKVHHCVVDGVGGNTLYELIFDDSPAPAPPVADTWEPGPAPNALELAVEAAGHAARARITQMEKLTLAMLQPRSLGHYLAETTRGLAALSGALMPAAPSSLSGPIGQSRRYAVARVPFVALRAVSKARQVTVNDVVLAGVTGAFRELLVRRGEEPGPDAVRVMVPVSVRPPHARNAIDNRVSMMLPVLPVDVADPVERLRLIHERMVELKSSKEAEASYAINSVTTYEPFPLVSLAFRAAAWFPQRNVITVTTNVPGPPNQLYFMGRRLIELLPYVPIAGRMRLGVSVMTYQGQAVFGVTGDFDSAPEVDAFAAGIAAELADLAARSVPAAPIKAAPIKPVPVKAVPGKAVPGKAVPVSSRAAKAVPAKAGPMKAAAVKAAPVKGIRSATARTTAATEPGRPRRRASA